MRSRCESCPVAPDVPCVAIVTGHVRVCQLIAAGRRDYADAVVRRSLARAGREAPLPSAASQVAGFAASAAKVVAGAARGGPVLADEATAAARLEICRACPHFRESDRRCSLCGCGTRGKARFAAATCPDRPPRWGPA